MPRVLIMASPELVSELSRTVLWRDDVDRVFAAEADRSLDRIHAVQADMVILGDEDAPATLELLRQMRGDGRTRGVSIAVVRRSVTLEEEEQLRRAGANVVFGGQVVPYLWDAWIEELLHVPRRRDARVPVSIAVWSHTAPGSEPARGMSFNISIKGMLLETSEPLDIGAKLDLSFTLPGTTAPLRAVGQVVREEPPLDGGPPRLGVEFLILREGAREKIRDFVAAGGKS
jgi:PilZ domain